MLHTRLTERLDLQYPIMSAPMAMHSGGTLAAAVSQAGGLGMFGGIHPQGGDWVRNQIQLARSKTERSFGVGFITQFLPALPGCFDVAIAERVPVIAFSFADPRPWITRAKDVGATAVCQVQTMDGAREAVDAGADILVAQGNEAGGHTGRLNLLPFLTQVVEAFSAVPVLASGGITSGRALAAVLAAGADGAWLGTALLATPEAVEVADEHKQLIIASDGSDTVFTEVFDIISGGGWPAGIAGRVRNNRFAREWHGREDEVRERQPELAGTVRAAEEQRDFDRTAVYYGQGAAAITAVRPAAEVVQRICDAAERILRDRSRTLLG